MRTFYNDPFPHDYIKNIDLIVFGGKNYLK